MYSIDTTINKYRVDVDAAKLLAAIKTLKPTSPFATDAIANAFCNSAKRFNVDQVYLLAHAVLESAWGTSRFAVDRNNFFGYMAYDSDPNKAKFFASSEECIDFIAKFISISYLSPQGRWYGGSPTLRGMNKYYATDKNWSSKIAQIATAIEDKLPTGPVEPLKMVTVIAQKGLNIRNSPTTQIKNTVGAFVFNQQFSVDGFVTGEAVNGNNLWWKLSGRNLYAWSGATNKIPEQTPPPVEPEAIKVDISLLPGWEVLSFTPGKSLAESTAIIAEKLSQIGTDKAIVIAIRKNATL